MPHPSSAPGKSRYHHGDLRRTLLDAALRLIADEGLAALNIRELARRAGVSPAAPFRHFESRRALLSCIAEEAMDLLEAAIADSLAAQASEDPMERFRALGHGFLRWALGHPVHFQVISARADIDFEAGTLRRRNDQIRAQMRQLLEQAESRGLLRPGRVEQHLVGLRALAYGLARMHADGQFPSWGLDTKDALGEAQSVLDIQLTALRAR